METPFTLAIDGGATRTRAGCYDADGVCVAEAEGPACNPVAYGEGHCAGVVVDLAGQLARPAAQTFLCAGISGANTPGLRARLAARLVGATGMAGALLADDVWPLLAANAGTEAAVLVISGTGATVLGQDGAGGWARAGGRGPHLGDEGSGYALALAGLHAASRAVDGVTEASMLSEMLPAAAGVACLDELPAWCAGAAKHELATLGATVLVCAERGDPVARRVVLEQAGALAQYVWAVARRLSLPAEAPVLVHGGVFEHSETYRAAFAAVLRSAGAVQPVRPVTYRGHEAVYRYGPLAAASVPETRSFHPG